MESGLISDLLNLNVEEAGIIEIGRFFNGHSLKKMNLIEEMIDPAGDQDSDEIKTRREAVEDFPIFTNMESKEILRDYIELCKKDNVDPLIDEHNLPQRNPNESPKGLKRKRKTSKPVSKKDNSGQARRSKGISICGISEEEVQKQMASEAAAKKAAEQNLKLKQKETVTYKRRKLQLLESESDDSEEEEMPQLKRKRTMGVSNKVIGSSSTSAAFDSDETVRIVLKTLGISKTITQLPTIVEPTPEPTPAKSKSPTPKPASSTFSSETIHSEPDSISSIPSETSYRASPQTSPTSQPTSFHSTNSVFTPFQPITHSEPSQTESVLKPSSPIQYITSQTEPESPPPLNIQPLSCLPPAPRPSEPETTTPPQTSSNPNLFSRTERGTSESLEEILNQLKAHVATWTAQTLDQAKSSPEADPILQQYVKFRTSFLDSLDRAIPSILQHAMDLFLERVREAFEATEPVSPILCLPPPTEVKEIPASPSPYYPNTAALFLGTRLPRSPELEKSITLSVPPKPKIFLLEGPKSPSPEAMETDIPEDVVKPPEPTVSESVEVSASEQAEMSASENSELEQLRATVQSQAEELRRQRENQARIESLLQVILSRLPPS